ncbi:hypothetical protein AALA61_16320 [Oscillospiraceae bacterium 42-9]
MATAKKNDVAVSISAMDIREFDLRIVGDTPLISHAWDEKAKLMMLNKMMKKATNGRETRDPFKDFVNSMYWLSEKPENPTMEDVLNATFGFPVIAFKAAAVDGGYQSGAMDKKTTARGAFHISGEMAVIEGTPEMREDSVRVGMGTDLRYRGEFKEWATTLHIRYNAKAMSMEQIINLFNIGGFACGVGEWRPSKDGSYGMFHVE